MVDQHHYPVHLMQEPNEWQACCSNDDCKLHSCLNPTHHLTLHFLQFWQLAKQLQKPLLRAHDCTIEGCHASTALTIAYIWMCMRGKRRMLSCACAEVECNITTWYSTTSNFVCFYITILIILIHNLLFITLTSINNKKLLNTWKKCNKFYRKLQFISTGQWCAWLYLFHKECIFNKDFFFPLFLNNILYLSNWQISFIYFAHAK